MSSARPLARATRPAKALPMDRASGQLRPRRCALTAAHSTRTGLRLINTSLGRGWPAGKGGGGASRSHTPSSSLLTAPRFRLVSSDVAVARASAEARASRVESSADSSACRCWQIARTAALSVLASTPSYSRRAISAWKPAVPMSAPSACAILHSMLAAETRASTRPVRRTTSKKASRAWARSPAWLAA
eukprot:scaffold15135_cov81-Isochrysis_galbana.AAC.1